MIGRIQFNQIEKYLFKNKIVIIYGARQIGKTYISKEILNSYSKKGLKTKYFNCEVLETEELLNTNSLSKLKALIGIYDLIVLDEAQKIPKIGQILKIIIDNIPKTQVIATGSSSFELSNSAGEPLVGRSRDILMYPISGLEIVSQYDINYLEKISIVLFSMECYPPF
jgi:predicted AAA+ superfamily ATPase